MKSTSVVKLFSRVVPTIVDDLTRKPITIWFYEGREVTAMNRASLNGSSYAYMLFLGNGEAVNLPFEEAMMTSLFARPVVGLYGLEKKTDYPSNVIERHTTDCLARWARQTFVRWAWEQAHPNHCTNCDGAGVIISSGSSVPYGATNVRLPDDIDPCSVCIDNGACPWCGEIFLTTEMVATMSDLEWENLECPFCDWRMNASDQVPQEYVDCYCWEEVIPDYDPRPFAGY